LEALQKEVAAKGGHGFEARKITVTRPDGEETNRMVWFDNEQKDRIGFHFNKVNINQLASTLSMYM